MCGFQEGATGPREVDTRGRQLAVLGGRSPGWARLAARAKTCLAESQAETCRLGRVPSRALVEPFLACTQPGPPLSLPLSTQWSAEPCPSVSSPPLQPGQVPASLSPQGVAWSTPAGGLRPLGLPQWAGAGFQMAILEKWPGRVKGNPTSLQG